MFTLDTDVVPSSAAALTAAITASLRKMIHLPAGATPVVLDGELPRLTRLGVDVSNGQVDPHQPLPDTPAPENQTPGPIADILEIVGDPISVSGVGFTLKLSATQVAFAYGKNKAGKLVATLVSAASGNLTVNIRQAELEAGILAIAQRAAASSGVAISKVQATLTSISRTELDVRLNVTARKFVSAMITISGRLSIDDQLVARASNLKADADGMVGGIAVNFIRPHLQKINGMPMPLMAFSLGNVKLRRVAVQTSAGLAISAEFAGEAA
jgi:hypothetical protein